jgi:hypothetical protein|tara:strand:- start:836 stop:1009 length:174 start_codon:yes stop_codon:yes gene_type:complete
MKGSGIFLKILSKLTDKKTPLTNWELVDYEINKENNKKYITIDSPNIKGEYIIYINC